jgi:hypothetical protein
MKKLITVRMSVLLLLFVCLSTGLWAQQRGEASPATLSHETDGTSGDDLKAKKELYKQLGMAWTYEDDASLDAAKEMLSEMSVSGNVAVSDVTALEEMEREFSENHAEWMSQDPAKYNRYVRELGLKDQPLAAEINEKGEVVNRVSVK